MKMTKKKVFIAALAICLVAIVSMGTLAWFTASDSVTNEFKVASSEDDGTPDFSVDVYEHDSNNNEVNKLEFTSVAPGDKLAKDPTVKNTGSYSQWIRVYVTFTNQDTDAKDLRTWLNVDDDKWTADSETTYDATAKTLTYVYYLKESLQPGNAVVLFDTVSIPSGLTQNTLKEFDITVKADAIQYANTGASAQEAFTNHWG